jgi:hypothetical protein
MCRIACEDLEMSNKVENGLYSIIRAAINWKEFNRYANACIAVDEWLKRDDSLAERDYFNKLMVDAERYRFMRNEDNWGEDSGDDSWEKLAQAHSFEFDAIVDSRMNKSDSDNT